VDGFIVLEYWRVDAGRFHFNSMIVTINNRQAMVCDGAPVMTQMLMINAILKFINPNDRTFEDSQLQYDTCCFYSDM